MRSKFSTRVFHDDNKTNIKKKIKYEKYGGGREKICYFLFTRSIALYLIVIDRNVWMVCRRLNLTFQTKPD